MVVKAVKEIINEYSMNRLIKKGVLPTYPTKAEGVKVVKWLSG
jgi:hypothetical protein